MRAIAVLQRNLDLSFLPDDLGDAVRRRLRELGGLALLGLAAAVAAALATWSVKDTSLSHATSAPVRNLLGVSGAVSADLMLQLIGLASIALIAPITAWGWRLLTHAPLEREPLRLGLWVVGIVLAAGFAACLPRTAGWPLPTGLGGVVGDVVLRAPVALLGPLGGTVLSVVAVVLGCGALAAIARASGLGLRTPADARPATNAEADGTERTAISIGWLVHGFLSVKAQLARLLTRAGTAKPRPTATRTSEQRLEPRLAADASTLDEAPVDEAAAKPARAPAKQRAPRAPRRTVDGYVLPPLNLLAAYRPNDRAAPNQQVIQENATALESVLDDFGVRGQIINARPGPVVTLYELEPAPGIKSSRVIGLADDIARSMSALSARSA